MPPRGAPRRNCSTRNRPSPPSLGPYRATVAARRRMQARVRSVVMGSTLRPTGLGSNSHRADTGLHDDPCTRCAFAGEGPRQLAGRQHPSFGGPAGIPGARRQHPAARARRPRPPRCGTPQRTRTGVGAGTEPHDDHVVVFGAARRGVPDQPTGIAEHGGVAARIPPERPHVPRASARAGGCDDRSQLCGDGSAGRGGRECVLVCLAVSSAVPSDARHGTGGHRRLARRDRRPVSGTRTGHDT